MTFDEFKRRCVELNGGRPCCFDEQGKHGWTSLEEMPLRLRPGQPGPHWCDAAPNPRDGRLVGKYDFLTGMATFFRKEET